MLVFAKLNVVALNPDRQTLEMSHAKKKNPDNWCA